MAEVNLETLRAGRKDPIECAYEVVHASAYTAGFVAGENAVAARTDLFRREMAVVLLGLGDAIAAGGKADMITWYGVASKLFACGAGE